MQLNLISFARISPQLILKFYILATTKLKLFIANYTFIFYFCLLRTTTNTQKNLVYFKLVYITAFFHLIYVCISSVFSRMCLCLCVLHQLEKKYVKNDPFQISAHWMATIRIADEGVEEKATREICAVDLGRRQRCLSHTKVSKDGRIFFFHFLFLFLCLTGLLYTEMQFIFLNIFTILSGKHSHLFSLYLLRALSILFLHIWFVYVWVHAFICKCVCVLFSCI